ncbi:MAG: MFS transporter [Eubacterium sp.]
MELNMTKGKMVLFVTALFLTNIVVMHDFVVIPVVANLYEMFEAQTNLVNYIISGPQLVGVVTALLCGKLMQYFSKKSLIVWGFAAFAVAAIFGVAIENVYFIAGMRTIVGGAMGIVNVAALALLAEVFVDENKRSMLMGWFNSAMAGVGAVMSLAAGFLATISWKAVFNTYWIAVPVLVLLIFFLPKTPPEKEMVEDGGGKKEPMPLKTFIPFCLSLLTFVTVFMVLQFMISLYVAEAQIGNEAYIGLVGSLSTLGSAVACFLFGFTYNKLRRGSIIPSYLILAVGYLLLYFTKNPAVTAVTYACMGAAFGNGFSYFCMQATVIAPPSQVSTAIGFVTAIQGFGMFFSTYFATILFTLLNVSTLTAIMPVLAGIAGIGAVLSVILTVKNREHKMI